MKRARLLLVCLMLCLVFQASAAAEQPRRLSPEARESIQEGLNIRLPAELPEDWAATVLADAPSRPEVFTPWPTLDWSVSPPEAQGMNRAALIEAFRYAIGNGSKAVVVTRHGYIVGEWYARDWDATRRQTGFSMAKSFSSALIGMLIGDGVFTGPDDYVSWYITEWRDWQRGPVQIRNLLGMDSGLYWSPINDYLILTTRTDQNAYVTGLPMEDTPGASWIYNNSACQMLSKLIVTSTGVQAADYARHRLWNPIGMRDASWMTDRAGNTLTYQSVFASAREFAKFGLLYLREGRWDGAQIVPRDWVLESTRPSQALNPNYGYLWWLNTSGGMWPDAPHDAYAAMGLNEKRIFVVPSLDLVVVRLGDGQPDWDDNAFIGPICDSITPAAASRR